MIPKPDIDELLDRSLLELLYSEPISVISVRAITDNCGVSIRTFYNHFYDKYDLANHIYYDMSENCWCSDGRRYSLREYLTRWTACACTTHRGFFVNTFSYHGQNNIRESIHKKGVDDLKRLLMWTGHEDVINDRMEDILSFYMYGLIAVFEKGLNEQAVSLDKWDDQRGLFFLPQPIHDYLTTDPNLGEPVQG